MKMNPASSKAEIQNVDAKDVNQELDVVLNRIHKAAENIENIKSKADAVISRIELGLPKIPPIIIDRRFVIISNIPNIFSSLFSFLHEQALMAH